MPVFTLNFYSVFVWALLIYSLPAKVRSKDLVFLVVIFVQFTLLAFMKELTVGQDTLQYYDGFQRFSNMSLGSALTEGWEPGYVMLNWFISHLGLDYRAFILLTSIFIYFSFCRFFYRYSSCVWLSVVIFIAFGYFFGSLHILRQYLAVSVVLYSYDFILKRRLVPFIVTYLIAVSFHASAILFLPTYFICRRSLHPKTLGLIFAACLLLAFNLGEVMMSYMVINEKYATVYLDSADGAGRGYSMLILLSVIMIVAMLFKPSHFTDKDRTFYWIFFIALCVQPFATVVSVVSRGILYWVVSVTVFLPLIISNIRSKQLRILSYVAVSVGLIIFFEFITNSLDGVERYATYELYKSV